jgi:branched-chain amino acid transport system permease protein
MSDTAPATPVGEATPAPARVVPRQSPNGLAGNWGGLAVLAFLIVFPFLVALVSGEPLAGVFASRAGNSKFYQGLLIEVFILGMYALSYDLVLGVTGLLSFGHSLFFAVGAYLTGILIKSFGWSLGATLAAVVVAGIAQGLLFSLVLPRVKGITFALVTLGMSAVFHIVIQTHELTEWTGGDVGLQGLVPPDFLNPTTARLTFYFVALAAVLLTYLVYRRFVNSPTGRVCLAIRENEGRALMLGYNTFYFKVVALVVSGITAALAGTLHAFYQPIVSPNVASLSFTVAALLMILLGGVGTLSGALLGAGLYRLLAFFLDRWLGEFADFYLGLIYVLLVLFVPYGVVGTWRLRALEIRQGRDRLVRLLTGGPARSE